VRREQALRTIAASLSELKRLGVRDLYLFGSVARDEARPDSDVDLLVEFDRPVGLLAFVALQQYLERLLAHRVDLVTQDALRPEFRDDVRAEALRAA
jgi:uncharacterized protein